VSAALDFVLPPALEAHEPPEERGLARDEVRLMVARRSDGRLLHARFSDLPDFLDPGDLLIVNVSGTIPAALTARRSDGTELGLHVSTPTADGRWLVELRSGSAPYAGGCPGEELRLAAGGVAQLLARYAGSRRLWVAELGLSEPLLGYLHRHGRPIRYAYVPERWPIAAYENVFATEPGSAEPPSAGRPFTHELITCLVGRGVHVAPIVLHAGVSSLEQGELPYPERYRVPETTARLVNVVRGWGGRVIAVGTTVVRALETVAGPDGLVSAGEGWTSLVVTPERGLRAVDGLITGWHEPAASHLQLLRAAAGDELLARSYTAALEHGYLWHEFGDSHFVRR
jgi:S-adenosylmethionine:tRNA ribosyltransferase-isomerase